MRQPDRSAAVAPTPPTESTLRSLARRLMVAGLLLTALTILASIALATQL
jgi:hypothetical protein